MYAGMEHAWGDYVAIMDADLVDGARDYRLMSRPMGDAILSMKEYNRFSKGMFGWPSMVCMMLFLGGIQLLTMGIMGQYLAKTYLETKKRPIYILAEKSQD